MIKNGTLISDRYRILNRIGSGGMAEVYESYDVITKETVALKILKEELLSDAEMVKRFNVEARAAASLNHSNIVRVYNVGEYEKRPYIVNEYIKGQTVRSILDYRGNLSLKESCDIMLQLTDAVNHAHQKNVVHCDIKTNNFFLMPDGSIKLADFGLARFVGPEAKNKSKNGDIAGSVHYLAPEILQGYEPTFLSDIYSLGIVFFELLTGQLPYDEGTKTTIAASHVNKAFPRITKFSPKTPVEVELVIEKAAQKKPQLRYKSAADMNVAINSLINNDEIMKGKKTFLQRVFGFKGEE